MSGTTDSVDLTRRMRVIISATSRGCTIVLDHLVSIAPSSESQLTQLSHSYRVESAFRPVVEAAFGSAGHLVYIDQISVERNSADIWLQASFLGYIGEAAKIIMAALAAGYGCELDIYILSGPDIFAAQTKLIRDALPEAMVRSVRIINQLPPN